MTGHLSSALQDERSSPKPQSSRTVEQAEAELERLRAAASADLQSLQADLVAKNRRIGQLEAELAKQAEETPEAKDAKELLLLWRDTARNGHKGTDVSLDSDRGRAVIKAIRKRGAHRVRKAILGVQFDEWAMGRTGKQDRPYNDIAKHILKDSDRFEHFEKLFDEHHPEGAKANVHQPPLWATEPDIGTGFVRYVYGDDCKLPPSTEPPKPRPVRDEFQVPPVDKILPAFHAAGCELRANSSDPDRWYGKCPAHDDRSPSLQVWRTSDGRMRFKCWTGCGEDDILHAIRCDHADCWRGSEYDTNAAEYGTRLKHQIPSHLQVAMRQLLERDERQAAA